MPATDAANAERFVKEHRNELRYVEGLKSWIHFDGKRWCLDRGLAAKRLAKETAQRLFAEAEQIRGEKARKRALGWAKTSNMRERLNAMIDVAKPELAISTNQLDVDPILLNVANGTLDLRTRELRPHNPDDFLTKIVPVPYVPGAKCEVWERALKKSLPDSRMRGLFQRVMGSALQG